MPWLNSGVEIIFTLSLHFDRMHNEILSFFFFLYCFDLCYCLISIIMMVPEAMPFSMICLMS